MFAPALVGGARNHPLRRDLLRPRLLNKGEIFTSFRRLVNLSFEALGDVPVPTVICNSEQVHTVCGVSTSPGSLSERCLMSRRSGTFMGLVKAS